MPWVLPKPSESGYTLGNQNFWNQMQSTIQLMQGVIGTLPALYKLFQEARAIGDNAAANAILLRINELAASLPRTPLGTIATTLGQLAAHQNLARRGFTGQNVYWKYLADLYARRIPYSQEFPLPISQEDDPNFVSLGGFLFPREVLELLQMAPEIRRAEAQMQAREALERALDELPPDARQGVRIAGPQRRPSTTERLEGVDPSNRGGARIMRSLSEGKKKQESPVNMGGMWLSPELMRFLQNRAEIMRSLQEALPGRTPDGAKSERRPSGMSLDEWQYLMQLREQLNRWEREP